MTRIHFSLLRDDITCRKKITKDTGWQSVDTPPRYSPYPVARPAAVNWEWRCFLLEADEGKKYRLLFDVAPRLGKWKAMLLKVHEVLPPAAIMRFEDQPGKHGGGLHVHANCDQGADLTGAASVDMVYTLPDHRRLRRRRMAWTKPLFCKAAGEFFHTDPIRDQEVMAL